MTDYLFPLIGGMVGGFFGYWTAAAIHQWRAGRRYRRFLRGDLKLR